MSRRRPGPPYGRFDAPTREQARHIERLIKRMPRCFWCKRPVAGGQVDGLDRPVHHRCSLACWSHKRFHDRAHPNPRLPQVAYTAPQTTVGEGLTAERTR